MIEGCVVTYEQIKKSLDSEGIFRFSSKYNGDSLVIRKHTITRADSPFRPMNCYMVFYESDIVSKQSNRCNNEATYREYFSVSKQNEAITIFLERLYSGRLYAKITNKNITETMMINQVIKENKLNIIKLHMKKIYKIFLASLKGFFTPLVLLKLFITDMKIALSNDPDSCVNYAAWVRKGRFRLGEDIISRNPSASMRYAEIVLKGRFELGEPAIATDTRCSYEYAKLLQSRFELGEAAISKNDVYSLHYAMHYLKDRFPLGEEKISKCAYLSTVYAREVINGRFIEGEESILLSDRYSREYLTMLLEIMNGMESESQLFLEECRNKNAEVTIPEVLKTGLLQRQFPLGVNTPADMVEWINNHK